MAVLVVGGIAGFTTRPKREDPKSQARVGSITTRFPGASPAEIEALISEPIEQSLREAQAIQSIDAHSFAGVSFVSIRLTDETSNVRKSWLDIQDKLATVTDELPKGASVPALVHEKRWNPHTVVVAIVDHSAIATSPAVLSRWAKELESRMRFVPGTRFSERFGSPQEEVLVSVDAKSLAALELTVAEVAEAIGRHDSNAAVADSQTDQVRVSIRPQGSLRHLAEIERIVIRSAPNGRQVCVGDIGVAERQERLPARSRAFVNGRRAVAIAATMDADENIDRWTESQNQVIKKIQSELPIGLKIEWLFSQKQYTDQRSKKLYGSLGIGMIIVVVVVWWMMGWRCAIPICLALPLTLSGVFFWMIPFGISLNQLSIAGLILALGMLIDNPIIVVDEIRRRCVDGDSPANAMVAAKACLTKPLVGSNVTTILGFAPILLLPGPTGEFLYPLGWAVIACLSVSLLLSLSIIPVVATWTLQTKSPLNPASSDTRPARNVSSGRILKTLFRFPILLLLVSVVLPVVGFGVASDLQEQFFPAAERDHFHFSLRLPSNTSIRETERLAHEARDILRAHPEVADVFLFIGTNAPAIHYSMIVADENRSEFAQGIVQLNTQRVEPHLIRKLQAELSKSIPEAQVVARLIMQGPATIAPIELRICGPSLETLDKLGLEARRVMLSVPGIIHSRSTLDLGGPQLEISLNAQESAAAGVPHDSVGIQIQQQLNGVVMASISEQEQEVPVRVRLDLGDRIDAEKAMSLPIVSQSRKAPADRQIVPLSSIATWSIGKQSAVIHRRNAIRCNAIQAYPETGRLPVVLENQFRIALQANDFQLPAGYTMDFGGISQERNSAVGNLLAYAAIISTLMASVLVMTFQSFRCAGIIVFVAILSIGLGLLSLWLFGFPIGLVAIIGLLGMMGLAINDSIVVLAECQHAGNTLQAISKCVAGSTRHILTTSLTTVGGVVPLILAGGEFWPPMMIVIAGGVTGATLLALAFAPAAYMLSQRKASLLSPKAE